MRCPLCASEFDETQLSCRAVCPMASLQGCHLLCCPNCGYQMVDERKSGLGRLLRRAWNVIQLDPAVGDDAGARSEAQ